MATVYQASGNHDTEQARKTTKGEEGELEEIQMARYDEEDPGETVEDVAKKQDATFSVIGQSCNFAIKARHVLQVWATHWLLGMQVHHL